MKIFPTVDFFIVILYNIFRFIIIWIIINFFDIRVHSAAYGGKGETT